MYGLDWATPAAGGEGAVEVGAGPGPAGARPQAATAYQYANILALERSVGARAARDPASGEMTFSYASATGVRHSVWYMDARAVLDALALARAAGLGVGMWRLGAEDQSLWASPLVGAARR